MRLKASFKRYVSLLLVFAMIFMEANMFVSQADETFTAYQDGEAVSWWKGRVDENTDEWRNATVAYIHITSGENAGALAYCIQNKKMGPKGEEYEGFNPWGTYYGAEWAEGARAILEYGYPNVSRPFGTQSDIEAYYATTQAFRFWVGEHDSVYSYYFSNLKGFSDDDLRSYARTGEIPDRLYSINEQGNRALIAAIELLIKARNHEGTKPEYSLSDETINAGWNDVNGSGKIDDGDTFVGYITVNMENTDRFIIDTTKLPLGTTLSDDYGHTATIASGTKTAFIGDRSAKVKIEIPYKTPVEGAFTNDMLYSGVNVYFSATGTRAQNNIVLAVAKDDSSDVSKQRLVFGKNDELVVGYKAFAVKTGSIIPETGTIKVYKKDSDTGKGIENVGFNLVNNTTGAPINTAIRYTDKDGILEFKYIPSGTYTLAEVDIPSGYKTPADTETNVIAVAGKVNEYTIYNTPYTYVSIPKGKIVIDKRDINTDNVPQGSAVLSGGIFDIYSAESANGYSKDELVDTLFSTSTIVASKSLPYGNYYVKERQAPVGYTVNVSRFDVYLNSEEKGVVISDKVISGKISINKYMDSTSTPEKNITFDITRVDTSDGSLDVDKIINKYDTTSITTDSMGYTETGMLPYGKYLVEQKNTTSGYAYVDSFISFIKDADVMYHYDLVDKAYKAKLRITKIDANTGTAIKNNAAGFEITYLETGNKLVNGSGTIFYTDTNGVISIDTPLMAGKYEAREITAPDGYYRSKDVLSFEVNETTGDVNGTAVIDLTFKNSPITGTLKIEKVGEKISLPSDVHYGTVYQINGSGTDMYYKSMGISNGYVSGAKIVVKAKTDIFDALKTTKIYSAGDIVKEFTSGNSAYEITGLPLGEYTVEETVAPNGYIRDKNIYDVSITSEGQDVPVVVRGKLINNNLVSITFDVDKKIQKTSSATPVDAVVGAFAFGIYTGQAFSVEGGTIGADTLVGIIANNTSSSEFKLPDGKYYVKELGMTQIGKDAGIYGSLTLNANKFPFEINYGTAVDGKISISANGSEPIINSEALFKIELTKKVGNVGAMVNKDGATLQVEDSAGNIVATGTTAGGKGIFAMLAPGAYVLRETKAPDGYKLSSVGASFTVGTDGTVSGTTYIYNEPIEVEIEKVSDTGVLLNGAKFNLYDNGMNLIKEIGPSVNGKIKITGISAGVYHLKETQAPDTYALSSATYTFSVAYDGTVSGDTRIINVKNTYKLTKTNEDGSLKLPGAVFEVYKEISSGTYDTVPYVSGTTDANGELSFALASGKYKVIEKTSPEGYIKNTVPRYWTVGTDGKLTGDTVFTNKKVGMAIYKTDAVSGNAVSGAKVRIWNDAGTYDEVKTTNSSGMISLTSMAPGKYKFKETEAPSGYLLNNETYEFIISDTGEITGTTTFKNTPNKTVIHKTDLTGGNPVPGAKITIYNSDGSVYLSGTTDANGDINISGIPKGNYTFKEEVAPDGYILNTTIYTFSVDASGNITGDMNITNEKTRVVIKKVDESGTAMEGVKLEISGRGGTLGTYTTDVNGEIVLGGLSIGNEYTIKEIATLDGYALPDVNYKFKLDVSGKIDGTSSNVFKIVNEKIHVVLTKENTSGTRLPGAKIGVYKEDGTLVGEYLTDARGEINLTGIVPGKYKFKEITAPDGYTINTNEYWFEVDAYGVVSGTTNLVNSPKRTPIITPTPEPTPVPSREYGTDVTIEKVNEDGQAMAKVKFVFYKNGNKLYTKETNASGKINLYDLSNGTYTYREIETLDGYVLPTTEFQFTVKNGRVSGDTKIINYKERNSIMFTKSDSNTNNLLPGAKYEIRDDAGKLIQEFETGNSGRVVVEGLENGTYNLQEIAAPNGYALDTKVYTFKVYDNFKVEGTTSVTDDVVRIQGYKVDENNNPLSNAKFGLFLIDENGKVADKASYEASSGSDGKVMFAGIKNGKYRFKEIAAPKGYELSDKFVDIVVDEKWENSNEYYTFINKLKVINEKPVVPRETPKMDDNSPVMKLSIVMGISLFGMGYCVFRLIQDGIDDKKKRIED